MLKTCCHCKNLLPLSNFSPNNRCCRECRRFLYKTKYGDRARKNGKIWRDNNKDLKKEMDKKNLIINVIIVGT